jgi:hypothetical protein
MQNHIPELLILLALLRPANSQAVQKPVGATHAPFVINVTYELEDLELTFTPLDDTAGEHGFAISAASHREHVDRAVIDVFYHTQAKINDQERDLVLSKTVTVPLVHLGGPGNTQIVPHEPVTVPLRTVERIHVTELKTVAEGDFSR